jgi:hypothetical protein
MFHRNHDDIYESDFAEILGALPDAPGVIRAYLMGGYGVLVSNDDPRVWWNALVQDRGKLAAADAVCELVLKKGGKRVAELIKTAAQNREVHIRADDSPLVRLLFEGYDDPFYKPERILINEYTQEYVVEHYKRSGRFSETTHTPPPVADPEPPSFEEEESESEEPDDDDSSFDSLMTRFSGKARESAQDGAQWTLERHQVPSQVFLSVPEDWTESDLEDFLWENWEKVDLGFDDPIYLVERQARLTSDTRDRVDLLARGRSGEWFAIELKIAEASARDWGQLTSYMGELEKSGVPADKIRGVLVAPSFDKKVLNAVRTEPRVTLLRFSKKSG